MKLRWNIGINYFRLASIITLRVTLSAQKLTSKHDLKKHKRKSLYGTKLTLPYKKIQICYIPHKNNTKSTPLKALQTYSLCKNKKKKIGLRLLCEEDCITKKIC